MTGYLVRKFIKNSEDIKNPIVRQSYGMFSGIVGIICNILLCAFKFLAGTITGSVSIAADALNNLSDAGSSIVTLIGFKMAGKPADTDHPFGHGRIEYLSGLVVSAAILVMGFELFKSSVIKIFNPHAMEFSIISVIILVGSIALKLWMCVFNRTLGGRIGSEAMRATAADSLSDCIATAAVLISLIVSTTTGFNIDGAAGVLVAIFVFKAGLSTMKDTIQPLLGKAPEPELVNEIEKIVLSHPEIIGIHDLIVHDYGPGRIFASVHAEVPYNMDTLNAHDIIDLAEREVYNKTGCGISIHMDPVVMDDETINELKQSVIEVLDEIDPDITMHDFRITNGPHHKNLIFDIVVPFDYKLSDDDLKSKISECIAERREKCFAVINVDKKIS